MGNAVSVFSSSSSSSIELGHRATLLTQEVTLGIGYFGVRGVGIGVSSLAGPLWMQLMRRYLPFSSSPVRTLIPSVLSLFVLLHNDIIFRIFIARFQ